MNPPATDVRYWISFEDDEEERTWMFDRGLLLSNLMCIYGNGCQGVLDAPAAELAQGCCSFGAHFVDEDDVANVVRAFVRLNPSVMQYYDEAVADGFLEMGPSPDADDVDDDQQCGDDHGDDEHDAIDGAGAIDGADDGADDGASDSGPPTVTRVIDDACIFLNRPGFDGEIGCALHIAAVRDGERPLDYKPNVCWQVPIRLEHFTDDNGHVVSRLRAWERRDWGGGGEDFAWWCTEADEAYVGSQPVYLSARDEIVELVGAAVYERLVQLITSESSTPVTLTSRS